MTKYSVDPAVADKSCKARGSNLRVHYKVLFPFMRLHLPVLSRLVRLTSSAHRISTPLGPL